jgi:monoamine oxidase
VGQGAPLSHPVATTRRRLLATAGAAAGGALLPGCRRGSPEARAQPLAGGWVGASQDRGHRLRAAAALPAPALTRRAAVLIAGGGIAGLAAARALGQRGIDDFALLELEDHVGGNARGHVLGGIGCPLGAHYLPLPSPEAREVTEWLHEIGLLRTEAGREVADERHLCHSPQERLFVDGQWVEGLLPPAPPGSPLHAQLGRFAARVNALARTAQGGRAFALPAARSPWGALHAALDAQTFAAWLAREGFDDPALRAYLDYCCRDDYGAGLAVVSAWAGIHYFACRHGFAAPGETDHERDAVFTWPEGNGWLVERLAAPLGGRVHAGRTVLAIDEQRHGVAVLAWDEARGRAERWLAQSVVVALPLHAAARVVQPAAPPLRDALRQAAAAVPHAPWLVANLLLDRPPVDRPGAPPAWDSVIARPEGASALGYVDARHQSLRPDARSAQPTVLTAYHALPAAERVALAAPDWQPWAARVLADLSAAHPDLRDRVQRVELMRWGHAMAVPVPGLVRHPALAALRAAAGRLRFAHSDLAGYSVFEEAFTLGHGAGRAAAAATAGAPASARIVAPR